ncbi:hypothetical protein MishRS11D_38180 [Methylomagnum ishizawai]|nr:hypothetical protein MishRS11D_38180 [Methylomagnum ishizawai]
MQTFSQSEDKNINFLKKYQMANIQIDIVEKKGSYCRLRPFMLDLRQGDICEIVSIPERIDRIQSVLDGTTKLPDKIAAAVESYSMAFRQAVPHEHLEGLRDGVYKSIGEFSGNKKGPPDALSFLESLLDINTIEEFDKDKEIATSLLETKDWEDDQRSEIQVRSDYVRAWRQVAERGYKGRKFSKSVIDAYDSRCLISGSRLPKTSANNVPGVDAAHILPWAKYDMDEVSNGLCLAKTYHWAFDAGILTVTFDRQENCYVVVLDKEVEALLRKEGCDLDLFIPHIGVIPESRLPKNQSLWPKPDFLDELNRLMKI